MLKNKSFEGKQVGVIYHFCDLDIFKFFIGQDDELKPSKLHYNTIWKTKDFLSFTRNSELKLDTLKDARFILRFKIDGDLISDNYKTTPYSAYKTKKNLKGKETDTDESEESVKGAISDFHKYIINILLIVKEGEDFSELLINSSSIYSENFRSLLSYTKKFNIPLFIRENGKDEELSIKVSELLNDANLLLHKMKEYKDVSLMGNLDAPQLEKLVSATLSSEEKFIEFIELLSENKNQLSTQFLSLLKDMIISTSEKIKFSIDKDDLISGLEYYLS